MQKDLGDCNFRIIEVLFVSTLSFFLGPEIAANYQGKIKSIINLSVIEYKGRDTLKVSGSPVDNYLYATTRFTLKLNGT